jgi:hypothetical protein
MAHSAQVPDHISGHSALLDFVASLLGWSFCTAGYDCSFSLAVIGLMGALGPWVALVDASIAW